MPASEQEVEKLIVIGYLRRSKERRAATASLEEQAARIRAYCETQEWVLARMVTDDCVSSGRREPWLADLVVALEANPRAERVVVLAEVLAWLEANGAEAWRRVVAWFEARGVRVVEVPPG
ncbi:MAG: recombinase family protein [Candidatus Methylomirabilia bacterium]